MWNRDVEMKEGRKQKRRDLKKKQKKKTIQSMERKI